MKTIVFDSGRQLLTASTYCIHGVWYIGEKVGDDLAHSFKEPDTPPFPSGSQTVRFLRSSSGALPFALIRYETLNFLEYKLFTINKGSVVPVHIKGTSNSTFLAIGAASEYGDGFSCQERSGRLVITSYSWGVAHPLTAHTERLPNGTSTYTPNTLVDLTRTVFTAIGLDAVSSKILTPTTLTYEEANQSHLSPCS